jgi:hypothetical protein
MPLVPEIKPQDSTAEPADSKPSTTNSARFSANEATAPNAVMAASAMNQ